MTGNVAQNRSLRICSESKGSGGALFVEVLNLTSWSKFSSCNLSFNKASSFGGGLASLWVNRALSLSNLPSSLRNNSASYGYNVGSPWKSLLVNNPYKNRSVLSGEMVSLYFIFLDWYSLVASGIYCKASLSISASTSDLPFQTDRSELTLTQNPVLRWITLDSFTEFTFLLPTNLTSNVFPNETAVITVNLTIEAKSFFTNFTVQICPHGYQLSYLYGSWTVCIPCQPGTYLHFSSIRDAFCKECGTGEYGDGRSQSCNQCSPGYISDVHGAQSCSPCSEGSFSHDFGMTSCDVCTSGYFSELQGSSNCEECIHGAITVNNGSASRYSCVCPIGFYGKPWESQECKRCSASSGNECGLNTSIPFVVPGFWRDPLNSANVFECLPSLACEITQTSQSTVCSEGYTGKRCGDCVEGLYFHFDNFCKKCGEKGASAGAILTVVCLLSLLVLNILSSRAPSPKRIELMSLISAIQFLALYPRLGDRWPPRTKALLDSLSISVSNFFHTSF
jgi:hypothetical protein